MLPDAITSPASLRTGPHLREPRVMFGAGEPGGALSVDPAFAELFTRAGLTTATAFLDLSGEVVSGHPDRHVVRVIIPGVPRPFYLKRQHVVGWREKWRNRRAGFGWVSRCEREAEVFRQLHTTGLPAPRAVALGTHRGRAFLLVEEVPDAIELRQLLGDNTLSPTERRQLAEAIGRSIAAVHATGFTTPDLTAKHALVNPDSLVVTFLDWQSAVRKSLSAADRADALGALHASLSEPLASRTDRLRALRAYESWSAPTTDIAERTKTRHLGLKDQVGPILRAAKRHAGRRSVRDQLQPQTTTTRQQLVWLAGEAVCAVPEVAAVWQEPAIGAPFYGSGPVGTVRVRFAGRDAVLVRGRTFAPLGRLRAWGRATPWRSPGATAGRVLFHLERYGVPAPKLLAFGQRLTSATRAEWFVLHEAPRGIPLRRWRRSACSTERLRVMSTVRECLRALHDAGCVLSDATTAFAVAGGNVMIADPRAVRIVRRVDPADRERDRHTVARLLGVE